MSRALKIRTRLGRQPGPIRSFEQSFTENEVFILPTTKIRAPLLSSVEEDAAFHEFNGLVLRNPRVGNLLDCTSISLPLPVDGLPVGLMLIGPRNADGRLLEIASAVEAVLRGQGSQSDYEFDAPFAYFSRDPTIESTPGPFQAAIDRARTAAFGGLSRRHVASQVVLR